MKMEKTYRIRFWYWHQQVVIENITAEELVKAIFFPDDPSGFTRRAKIDGYQASSYAVKWPIPKYEIEVSINEKNPDELVIAHILSSTEDTIDVNLGNKGGFTFLGPDEWILEEERYHIGVDLGEESGDRTTLTVSQIVDDAEEGEEVKINRHYGNFKLNPEKFRRRGHNRL